MVPFAVGHCGPDGTTEADGDAEDVATEDFMDVTPDAPMLIDILDALEVTTFPVDDEVAATTEDELEVPLTTMPATYPGLPPAGT